jgi:hypothetical protein
MAWDVYDVEAPPSCEAEAWCLEEYDQPGERADGR